jgi:hypothetical protein
MNISHTPLVRSACILATLSTTRGTWWRITKLGRRLAITCPVSPGQSNRVRRGDTMKKALVLLSFLVALFARSAVANDTLVKFRGGIGDIPVANVAGTANPDGTFPDVTRNIVRGVEPAGQIWVISALKADVKVDGRIHVDGRGLLLGGGNAIGLTANASVFATLICEAVAPFTEHSTNGAGVALEPNGDFRIDDVLVPAPPADCASPVLLIRNAEPNPAWFAAGIPEQD